MGPWPYFDEEQIAAAADVLRSGKINYWTGDACRAFESEFAATEVNRCHEEHNCEEDCDRAVVNVLWFWKQIGPARNREQAEVDVSPKGPAQSRKNGDHQDDPFSAGHPAQSDQLVIHNLSSVCRLHGRHAKHHPRK